MDDFHDILLWLVSKMNTRPRDEKTITKLLPNPSSSLSLSPNPSVLALADILHPMKSNLIPTPTTTTNDYVSGPIDSQKWFCCFSCGPHQPTSDIRLNCRLLSIQLNRNSANVFPRWIDFCTLSIAILGGQNVITGLVCSSCSPSTSVTAPSPVQSNQ